MRPEPSAEMTVIIAKVSPLRNSGLPAKSTGRPFFLISTQARHARSNQVIVTVKLRAITGKLGLKMLLPEAG